MKNNKNKKMGGDTLGISDTPASTHIPQGTDRGGHPKGIEIGEHHRRSATGDSKGATGIDMGAGGSGTDISADRK